MTNTKRFLWILSWFGLFILSQLPIISMMLAALMGQSLVTINTTVALVTILVLTTFILVARKSQLIRSDLSWFKAKDLRLLLLCEAGISLTNIIGLAVMATFNHASTTANQMDVNQMVSMETLFPMGLAIVLIAPITEEILCRGIIPKKIFHGHEKWGYLLGWLVFALLHKPTNLGSFIIYGGMSAIVTYLAYRSQRLEMPIFLHMIHNGLTYLVMILAVVFQLPLS